MGCAATADPAAVADARVTAPAAVAALRVAAAARLPACAVTAVLAAAVVALRESAASSGVSDPEAVSAPDVARELRAVDGHRGLHEAHSLLFGQIAVHQRRDDAAHDWRRVG